MKSYRNEDGEWHQVNAPAFKWGDNYAWYYNGDLHRYYGQASNWIGSGGNEYWIFGEQIE